jgi:hypothetical protein
MGSVPFRQAAPDLESLIDQQRKSSLSEPIVALLQSHWSRKVIR